MQAKKTAPRHSTKAVTGEIGGKGCIRQEGRKLEIPHIKVTLTTIDHGIAASKKTGETIAT